MFNIQNWLYKRRLERDLRKDNERYRQEIRIERLRRCELECAILSRYVGVAHVDGLPDADEVIEEWKENLRR